MRKFSLVSWTVFLMTFLAHLQFSDAKLKIEIGVKNLKNVNASCCHKNLGTLQTSGNKFLLDCDRFWSKNCFIRLRTDQNDKARKVKIHDGKFNYTLDYVKSIKNLKFKHTESVPEELDVEWILTVNTANTSKDIMGRIYFTFNCRNREKRINIPLANRFDNFEPGRTDEFNFKGPRLNNEYCVKIQNSLNEKWIMTSMILTQLATNVNYTFYHGEETTSHTYFGYKGSDSVNWTIAVTTGYAGMDCNLKINLRHNTCATTLTLDTADDNFRPNTTDVFNVQAKNCNTSLQKIRISANYCSKWVLVKINATRENGNSYIFYHNETLSSQQTFFVNQTSGENEWTVSVCSVNPTDDEVWLKIHGRFNQTEMIRLTTQADDFQANQCNNFTLFLKDIANLSMIEVEKPNNFIIKTITLYNADKEYKFEFPPETLKHYKIIYAKELSTNEGYPPPSKMALLLSPIYTSREESVWLVFAKSKSPINSVQFKFNSLSNNLIILTLSMQKVTILKKFAIESKLFNSLIRVDVYPQRYRCSITEIILVQPNISLDLEKTSDCSWRQRRSTLTSSSSPTSSITPHSRTNPTTESTSRNTAKEIKRNCSMCIRNCLSKNISREEMAEKLNKLTKELKVNRNQTSNYLRSKISAPDERASSKVIGSMAVVIISVPFGLIIFVDLIPLFNLIYKKVISLM